MKGLLKGLRYISQIFGQYIDDFSVIESQAYLSFKVILNNSLFHLSTEKEDEEEEEEEMQIGFPTDVKHVAHIGWDGPAVSSPSWVSTDSFHCGW